MSDSIGYMESSKERSIGLESAFLKEISDNEPPEEEIEQEEEEEVPEEEVEEEEVPEEEAEQPEAKKPPQIEKKKEPEKQEELQVPTDPRIILEQQKVRYLIHALNSNGYECDEKTYKQAYDKLAADHGSLSAQDLMEYAKSEATRETKEYIKKSVEPYHAKKMDLDINGAVNFLRQEFPDIDEYAKEMKDVADVMLKKYPQLHANPIVAIPMFYAKAKEKRLAAAAREVRKNGNSQKTAMERGSARQTKGPAGTKSAEDKEVQRIFGQPKSDPLAKFFK